MGQPVNFGCAVSKIKQLRNRKWKLKHRYGLSVFDYNEMLRQQNMRCGICGIHHLLDNARLNVDHCHDTNTVRGLLCGTCNVGLGMFLDSEELLEKAKEYLCQRRK